MLHSYFSFFLARFRGKQYSLRFAQGHQNITMKKFPSLLALTAALFVPVAQAELTTNQVFNVNFADGSYTNGPIVVTNLGIYQGGWQQTGTATNNGTFITNNNQASMPATSGQDIWKAFTSNTIVVVANNFGGYLQTKINFSITSATTNGDYFFHLSTVTNTTSSFPQRLFAKSDGSTNLFLGLSGSSSTGIYGTNPLSLNTTYNAVIQWSFLDGTNNDTLSLFVDPTDPILTNNAIYAATAFTTDQSTVAAANLRIGGGTLQSPGVLVNSIEIGTVVPEPSTYALLLLSGAASLWALKRRKS
jgi:hypothetical protein